MAWGLEARVPFLDREFLEYSMSLEPSAKMCGNRIEKWLIRNAFDDKENPYLPEEVLWRQKEQFSDGVGYSWIDSLKDEANKKITDLQMKHAESRFPVFLTCFLKNVLSDWFLGFDPGYKRRLHVPWNIPEPLPLSIRSQICTFWEIYRL